MLSQEEKVCDSCKGRTLKYLQGSGRKKGGRRVLQGNCTVSTIKGLLILSIGTGGCQAMLGFPQEPILRAGPCYSTGKESHCRGKIGPGVANVPIFPEQPNIKSLRKTSPFCCCWQQIRLKKKLKRQNKAITPPWFSLQNESAKLLSGLKVT